MEKGSNSSSTIWTLGSRVAACEDSGRPIMLRVLMSPSSGEEVEVEEEEEEGVSSPRMESNSLDIRRRVGLFVVSGVSVRLLVVKGGWGMVKDRVDSFGSRSNSVSDAGSTLMIIQLVFVGVSRRINFGV